MRLFFLLSVFALAGNIKAGNNLNGVLIDSAHHFYLANDTVIGEAYSGIKKKKWVAAILAFPLFGVTGIHRVYLGTQPYVPVVYMATVGGYLILPTIDFFAILFADEETFQSFQNNPHVFMWAR